MNTDSAAPAWLGEVAFNDDGLLPVIAQDAASGVVLMLAWMNAEALVRTAETGVATYFSRSRQRLWVKGESSGHRQDVLEMRLDCDADCVLLRVRQHGGIACHTGREHCFYQRLEEGAWQPVEPVLREPGEIYAAGSGA